MRSTPIIAHRGASAYEPENTLKAIEKAIELDADLVEVDARLSKDGHVVAIHDERVDRTTDGKGLVEEMTLNSLKALDAGSREEIPTLKEILDLVAGRIGLVIEIKVPKAVKGIVKEVREKEMVKSVFISSFYHGIVGKIKELEPNLRTGVIFSSRPIRPTQLASNVKADALLPRYLYVDTDMVDQAHKKGLMVYPWTVDNPNEAKRLIDLGSDGIVTNRPDLLK